MSSPARLVIASILQVEDLDSQVDALDDAYSTGDSDESAIPKALSLIQKALEATPIEDASRWKRLERLSVWHHRAYTESGRLEDLDLSLKAVEDALRALPTDMGDQRRCLTWLLTDGYRDRFLEKHDAGDIGRAIALFEEAISSVAEEHVEQRCRMMKQVADYHFEKYKGTGEMGALDSVIQVLDDADALSRAATKQVRFIILENLAECLWERLDYSASIEDHDLCVRALEEALSIRPQTHDETNRSLELLELATWLKLWKRNPTDIMLHNQEGGGSYYRPYRTTLKDSLLARYGDLEDIDRAVAIARNETTLDLSRADIIAGQVQLAQLLAARFRALGGSHGGGVSALDEAFQLTMDLINGALDCGNPHEIAYVARGTKILSTGLKPHEKYLAYLDGVIKLLHIALELCKDEDGSDNQQTDHVRIISSLQFLHAIRYERNSDPADLDQQISFATEMIDQKSHSTLEDQADARSRLATGLMLRYHQNGGFHLDDIKRAVSEVEMVLHLLPTNNPERWYHMRTLALCLKLRYLGSSSSCADLDRALQLLQDFLDGAPDCGSHGEDDFPFIPRRGVIVMMMAELFSIRSKWAWENDLKQGDYKADLDRCLEYAQKAVEMNEPDSIRNAIDTLSEAYATRYRQSSQRDGAGDPNDIDLAIKYRIAAAEQARKDGVGLSHILRQLAILYSLKRTLYGTQDGSTSPSSASLARRFLEMALEAYSQCSKSPDCSTYLQIQTLVESTPIHVALGQWAEAVDTWEQALDAMPNLNMRSASFADQEFQIKEYAGQSARVVSASILSGRRSPADSLRLLERGRGMIASFLQIRRADISALDPLQSSAFTEALSRWDEMRRQVQDAGAGFEGGGQQKQQQQSETGIWASQSQKFRRAEYELRSVIQDIQTDPRTSDLLGPPSIDTVRSLLGSDTIVVFNVSTLRCDAFLISNSPATPGVSLLELKQVTAVGIMIWVDRLRATRPLIDSQMLEWLWTDITRPILDFLGFKVDGAAIPSTTRPVASHSSYNDSAPLPRIIWIPTGPICHLPLHAAGIHISRGSSVMDHVISSYSPSLKEFVLGRKQLLSSPPPAFRASSTSALEPSSISSEAAAPTCSTAPSTVQKALLIGASNPSSQPGRPHTLQSLPFVSTEIDQVSAICHALNLNPVSLQDPTRESVLDSLPATTIFHFAGHGLADAREPSRSALILADGHLTVSSLLDQGLESRGDDVKTRPYLAFLSACLTGANDIDELADEGIHLIAAFQLIGFSHVIGTLWQVADSACVDVSVGVYQGLHDSSSRGSGGDGMSTRPAHESVCRSLHRTLVNLRDEWRVGIESSMLPTREDEDEKSDEIVELPGVGISACGDERRPVTERSVTSEEEDDNVKRWASLKLGKKVKSPRRLVRADWIPYVHYGS